MSRQLKAKLEEQRKRLLDLTSRNKLLNYKHAGANPRSKRQSYLRIVDEIPEFIIERLESEKNFELIAKPKDKEYEVDLKLISEVETLSKEQKDNKIQVLEELDIFKPSCEKLRNDNRLSNQERGINVLQIAIGFLSWFESKGITKEEERLSPLLLFPVEITRSRSATGYKYYLESTGEDLKINTTLWRKLKEVEGLSLPDLELDEEGAPKIKKLFQSIITLLKKRNSKVNRSEWSLKSWSTVGLFSFSNISIYNDLDFENWDGNPLEEKEVLKSFVQGTPCGAIESMGSLELYQDKEEVSNGIDEVPRLIADADSTQYAVIKKSLEDKSLVVQGPPGTGKSQTITNIIASLLGKGKRVLFAADKLAALEVVHNRLADKGIDQFCLEVHSTGTAKAKVIDNLKERLSLESPRFSKKKHQESYQKLKELRKGLNEHSDVLNNPRDSDKGEVTIHDLIWSQINFDLDVSSKEEKEAFEKAASIKVDQVSKASIDLLSKTLNNLSSKIKELETLGLVEIISTDGIPDTETNLSALISKATDSLPVLIDLVKEIDESTFSWKQLEQLTSDDLNTKEKQIKELTQTYSISGNQPLNNQRLDELSKILEKVIEREASQDGLEPWTDGFLNNQDKFNSVKECLEKILEAYSTDYEHIQSVEECIEALQVSTNLLRDLNRKFSRKDKSLPTKCTISLLINALETVESIGNNSLEAIHTLLTRTSHADDIQQCFIAIKEIQKTTSLAIKIREKGLDPLKVCAIGADRFEGAEQAIKSAGFLGCLFDKDVRAAKNLWKQCSLKGFKRPKLSSLARVYLFAKDYSNRIQNEENNIKAPGFGLDQIKDLAERIEPTEELLHSLGSYKSKSQEIPLTQDGSESLLNICSDIFNSQETSISKELQKSSIEKIMEKTLEESQPLVSKLSANIKTKVSLLDESIAREINKLSWTGLDDLLQDIEGYRDSANSLSKTLEDIAIFDASGLEYSITSKQIDELIRHISSMDISNWEPKIKSSLESSGPISTLGLISQIKGIKTNQKHFTDLINKKPLSLFLQDNECLLSEKEIEPKTIENKLSLLNKLKEHQPDVLQILRDKKSLNKAGIENGLPEIIKLSNTYNIEASKLFKYASLNGQSLEIGLEDKISSFSGTALSSSRELFCEIDKEFISSTSEYLYHSLCSSTSSCLLDGNSYGSPKDFTEGPLIQHEVKKQKRHIPMRLLLSQAFESISNLKPCWMMSPASAAELLPKQSDIFDVLIIDEASQMKPEKAFSLIARCKQLIIVGDRKQLPPTNFFQKQDSQAEDEDIEIEDNESILELADKVISNNGCSLGWHYRSRHQSLIAFSNHYFYDDALTIFASNSVGSEVKFHPVEAPNYRGGVNLPEVEETITALKKQIKEAPNKSILIATMNEAQTSELKLALEKELSKDPDLDAFTARHKGTLDELVVKNLENVQGDERDVVIISTVYGPNAEGRVMQNFGPINKDAGWRRLNVLFTRAKHRVILVSSLKPADIVVTPKSSRGVQALKDYLAYAQTGRITDTGVKTSGDIESPFEEAVFNSLKERGYQLDLQVGVGAYRIDMAIKDPEDPSKYLLAIECDGAAYHSSYSARSRDRLRQEVLEGLGWQVYRIWSTDWFRDPKGELDLLEKRIKSLKTS